MRFLEDNWSSHRHVRSRWSLQHTQISHGYEQRPQGGRGVRPAEDRTRPLSCPVSGPALLGQCGREGWWRRQEEAGAAAPAVSSLGGGLPAGGRWLLRTAGSADTWWGWAGAWRLRSALCGSCTHTAGAGGDRETQSVHGTPGKPLHNLRSRAGRGLGCLMGHRDIGLLARLVPARACPLLALLGP